MDLAWLDRELTSAAYIWRLDRADGVSLGFASHDHDIIYENFRYRSAPGMVPSTIAKSDTLEIDSVEIEGVMSDSAIAEQDLESGRWNGSKLTISLIDWENPEQGSHHLITGEFGEISRIGEAFRVEILGATSFLDEAIAPLTSPTCRARFGDRRCKKSLSNHQHETRVQTVMDDQIVLTDLPVSADAFAYGELRWLNGPNTGLSSAIIQGEQNRIWIADQPQSEIQPGDRALLTEGCDKNFSTCQQRFNNSINFRGEPHLPGNDLLTRYPGA